MSRSVLFLTHQPPYPASTGDAVRNWNLMRQLAERGWRVSLFTLVQDGGLSPETKDALDRVCERVVAVPVSISRTERLLRVARTSLARRPFQFEYLWDAAAALALGDELAMHK